MIFEKPGEPLQLRNIPLPEPRPGQVLVKVAACAVCRTDLHILDGELDRPTLPLVPGHEIVGRIEKMGPGCRRFRLGDRVGIPWLGWTCGECDHCRSGRENLCDAARFTGYTIDGGYAEFTLADERFCFAMPREYKDVSCAPLLCAGLIGYRCLRKTGDAHSIGLYGFGAAAHIVIQIARHEGGAVYGFTRPGDIAAQDFARSLGATWAGSSEDSPPKLLDAAIIFAPIGELVPRALRAVRKGGIVVCGGIHMSDIPSFPYRDLWHERAICSVANLTRRDGDELFALAPKVPVRTHTEAFPLEAANEALSKLRSGALSGAAVLVPELAAP